MVALEPVRSPRDTGRSRPTPGKNPEARIRITSNRPQSACRQQAQDALHRSASEPIWNGAELARSLAVGEHTVRRYLDVLAGAYVMRQLPPWLENLGKRQYKAPKVYVRDSGLLHALLSIATAADLEGHPKYGASWEGFAVEQVLGAAGTRDAYYWGTHAGAELDLLLVRHGKRFGVEFKAGDAPRMTRSLHIALDDLKLQRAWIVYPGTERYGVHERVDALPLTQAAGVFAGLARG